MLHETQLVLRGTQNQFIAIGAKKENDFKQEKVYAKDVTQSLTSFAWPCVADHILKGSNQD